MSFNHTIDTIDILKIVLSEKTQSHIYASNKENSCIYVKFMRRNYFLLTTIMKFNKQNIIHTACTLI